MTRASLVVSEAGKAFRTYRSEWQRVLSWFDVPTKPATEHWALRGISFSVAPGEAVGLVGRNGAGKSTLLKLIAGTLRPSEGTIEVHGRIAAVLELGMGFNPDFSGRQNASHAIGLMGFAHKEIEPALREIEDFADIGDYFQRPIRTYSSGMQMRLAFAVATTLRPQILMVDEALAVGDAAFQRKSLHRIERYVDQGTALLYVSHSTETVKRLSPRAIWIADGNLAMDGDSKQVCEAYEQYMLGNRTAGPRHARGFANFDGSLIANIEKQYGDGRAEIVDFGMFDDADFLANVIRTDRPFSVGYSVLFFEDCPNVHFGMMIKTVEGVCVYATNTSLTHPTYTGRKGEAVRVRFRLKNNLAPGLYYLNCGTTSAAADDHQFLHRRVDVAMLRVTSSSVSAEAGLANLQATTSVERLAP